MFGLTLAFMLSGIQAADVAPATVTIEEWQVPYAESRPRDPYVHSSEKVWFVGQRADYAAILNPQTGDFERIDLPAGVQSMPYAMAADNNGYIWFAETGVQPNRIVGFHIDSVPLSPCQVVAVPCVT
ncbi:Vgb family protein [Pseudidiomarina salilacus]|uniref:Vgb family protein n=1 Tax=Pseudidiomarina salilacus TaxID=3384452 RepID=UPI003984A9CF